MMSVQDDYFGPSELCGHGNLPDVCHHCKYEKEITVLRHQLTEAQERENYLVEILSKAARWSEGSQTYAHAIGHIENVISNLRCDLKVEKAENERLKSLYDDLLYCVESKVPGQTRHETAKATLQAAGWDGSEVPKQALKG